MCEYCKDEMNGIHFCIGDTGFMAFKRLHHEHLH